jgi:beta-aspartyl-peptidase (threonine type)
MVGSQVQRILMQIYSQAKSLTRLIVAALVWVTAATQAAESAPFTIVVHGGAGTMNRKEMSAEKEAAYHAALKEAVRAGQSVLRTNGTSTDAVIAAIKVMEDSPLFNAGKGAVLTADGTAEMDAAIMEGTGRKAGTVASLKHIKNPIELARLVMDKTPHVMIAGVGAEKFAQQQGIAMMPEEYFITEHRKEQLEKIKQLEQDKAKAKKGAQAEPLPAMFRMGTVGAVALDRHGNLAAGTSTGGLANKRPGRVGDSPIIGAGTYANNATCAISATGQGEFFIRAVVAYDIAALMEYKGMSVKEAAEFVVMKKLKTFGGDGGLIALDRQGNFATPFNTEGMHRGYARGEAEPVTAIFKE